jgi:mRNA-degrading endonuclease RelE of RelBE toxin-antitoxin system
MLRKIIYSQKAKKDLKRIDFKISQSIILKINFYTSQEDYFSFAKPLKNLTGLYRFRIGEYRALFTVNKEGVIEIIDILKIQHRKEIYKNL